MLSRVISRAMALLSHPEQLDKKPLARVFLDQDYALPPIADHLLRDVDKLRHVLVRTLKRTAVKHLLQDVVGTPNA